MSNPKPTTDGDGIVVDISSPCPSPSAASSDQADIFAPDVDSSSESEDGSVFELESDEDVKPTKGKGKTAAPRNQSKTARSPIKSVRPTGQRDNAGSARKGEAWIGDEDWMLFEQLYPRAKVSWAAVGEAVGRDAKVSTDGQLYPPLYSFCLSTWVSARNQLTMMQSCPKPGGAARQEVTGSHQGSV